jgi:formate dehydrogenase subunit gamma
MNGRMIKRHSKLSIFLHWFNAASWMFLLATGIGLINNPDLQPVGMWWTNLMWGLFGSGENLLRAHVIGGIMWTGVFLIYAIFGIKQVGLFLKEIFSYSPVRDFMWLVKKGIQMTLGTRALKSLGKMLEKRGANPEIAAPRIPDQGFYNVGQKMFAVPSVLGGVVIAVTGIIMALSNVYFTNTAVVRWAILIHFVTAGLVFAGLLIHIYMASIAAGERPAFISMFTGNVPEEYAKHHHRLWYEEVKES